MGAFLKLSLPDTSRALPESSEKACCRELTLRMPGGSLVLCSHLNDVVDCPLTSVPTAGAISVLADTGQSHGIAGAGTPWLTLSLTLLEVILPFLTSPSPELLTHS